MREGAIKVREILPADSTNFTDKQIQEALWHYYYDIEKSVTYLLGTLTPKVTKKAAGKKSSGELISLRLESFSVFIFFFCVWSFFCRIKTHTLHGPEVGSSSYPLLPPFLM